MVYSIVNGGGGIVIIGARRFRGFLGLIHIDFCLKKYIMEFFLGGGRLYPSTGFLERVDKIKEIYLAHTSGEKWTQSTREFTSKVPAK